MECIFRRRSYSYQTHHQHCERGESDRRQLIFGGRFKEFSARLRGEHRKQSATFGAPFMDESARNIGRAEEPRRSLRGSNDPLLPRHLDCKRRARIVRSRINIAAVCDRNLFRDEQT